MIAQEVPDVFSECSRKSLDVIDKPRKVWGTRGGMCHALQKTGCTSNLDASQEFNALARGHYNALNPLGKQRQCDSRRARSCAQR